MFWVCLILSVLGLMFVKLGSYSVWMMVFAIGFKMAFIVIVVLAGLLIWNKYFKKGEKNIAAKPGALI